MNLSKLKFKMNNLIGIDIFSGAGGMSIGAKKAGIKIVAVIEANKCYASTYLQNHSEVNVICEDIRNVDPRGLTSQPFVLFGGSPCQGFSKLNTKTRKLDNGNNWLFKEFIRFVRELRPIWFVFENVPSFKNFNKGSICNELETELFELGYKNIDSFILDASNYSVPQIRKRFFMIGNNVGIKFIKPKRHIQTIIVQDAIADLPNLYNLHNAFSLPYKIIVHISNYAKLIRYDSCSSKQNFVTKNKKYVIERYKYINPNQNWKAIPKKLFNNYNEKNITVTCIKGLTLANLQ